MRRASVYIKSNFLTGYVQKRHDFFMARSLPPLNALRAFEAAGRHESFWGLEDRLGAQLFRDLPRGVTLTQAGARYLSALTPAFERIAEASEMFDQRPAGQVTIDAEPLFATNWLLPRLADFRQRFPDVEVRLEANPGLADIARYEADLAIRFFHAGPANQDAPLLSNAPLHPYATPELVPDPLPPEELLKLPLLRDRRENTWREWARLAGCAPPPIGNWRLRARLSYQAAILGYGVLLTTAEIVAADVAAGRLVQCSDIGFRMGSYHLVTGEGVTRRGGVRRFRDWLLDQSVELRSSIQ